VAGFVTEFQRILDELEKIPGPHSMEGMEGMEEEKGPPSHEKTRKRKEWLQISLQQGVQMLSPVRNRDAERMKRPRPLPPPSVITLRFVHLLANDLVSDLQGCLADQWYTMLQTTGYIPIDHAPFNPEVWQDGIVSDSSLRLVDLVESGKVQPMTVRITTAFKHILKWQTTDKVSDVWIQDGLSLRCFRHYLRGSVNGIERINDLELSRLRKVADSHLSLLLLGTINNADLLERVYNHFQLTDEDGVVRVAMDHLKREKSRHVILLVCTRAFFNGMQLLRVRSSSSGDSSDSKWLIIALIHSRGDN